MKNIFTIILVIATFSQMSAQHFPDDRPGGKARERMEQFEKIRLLEILDLDEDVAVKFFTRKDKHRDRMSEIMKKRNQLMKKLYKETSEGNKEETYYKQKISEVLEIESELAQERKNFVDSLWDLLTAEQIAMVVTFESQFRSEVRGMMKDRGMGRGRP